MSVCDCDVIGTINILLIIIVCLDRRHSELKEDYIGVGANIKTESGLQSQHTEGSSTKTAIDLDSSSGSSKQSSSSEESDSSSDESDENDNNNSDDISDNNEINEDDNNDDDDDYERPTDNEETI